MATIELTGGHLIAAWLRDRTGQEFDGECHLTEDEAEKLAQLALAADRVFNGLNARIDAADATAVPVFDGIADLNDALYAFEDEAACGA